MERLIKLKQNRWMQLIIIYSRYLLGGAFVFASIIKIKGLRFTTESGINYPIDEAWHFFETLYASGLYWQFIGLGQLLTGLLLLTQRFSKLGALLSLPITVNIFVITLSYYFAYTPVITGMMLLANLLLLTWDWNSLRSLVNLPIVADPPMQVARHKSWVIAGISIFLFTTVYRMLYNQYDLFLWMGVCAILTLGATIWALRSKPAITRMQTR